MDYIFESIDNEFDYGKIKDKILYKENQNILEEHYTENEFVSLDMNTKKKISNELKLNFKFVLTFGTSITAFFPIIESFITNSGISQISLERDTVVYLGICVLAIVFDQPKETYRKLFTELRMRNVYGLLENLVTFIDKLKSLFNFVVSTIGKITFDIFGMFSYTSLFVPFALTLATLLQSNQIDLQSIIDAISQDGITKLTTVGIGVTGITLREIVVDLINKLKNFKFSKVRKFLSKSFYKIKDKVNSVIHKFKSKVNIEKIDRELKFIEKTKKSISTGKDILKWDDWRKQNDLPEEVERIDEEK